MFRSLLAMLILSNSAFVLGSPEKAGKRYRDATGYFISSTDGRVRRCSGPTNRTCPSWGAPEWVGDESVVNAMNSGRILWYSPRNLPRAVQTGESADQVLVGHAFKNELVDFDEKRPKDATPRLPNPNMLHPWKELSSVKGVPDAISVFGFYLPPGKKVKLRLVADNFNFPYTNFYWRHEAPEGSVSLQLLYNKSGRMFEIKSLTKEGGEWFGQQHDSPYPKPAGYKHNDDCNSCHDAAGLTGPHIDSDFEWYGNVGHFEGGPIRLHFFDVRRFREGKFWMAKAQLNPYLKPWFEVIRPESEFDITRNLRGGSYYESYPDTPTSEHLDLFRPAK